MDKLEGKHYREQHWVVGTNVFTLCLCVDVRSRRRTPQAPLLPNTPNRPQAKYPIITRLIRGRRSVRASTQVMVPTMCTLATMLHRHQQEQHQQQQQQQ